jgi:hypothetical protein
MSAEPSPVLHFPEDSYREGPFLFGPTSLQVLGNATFDQWAATGTKLKTSMRAVHWWLGDWILYGERVHGQIYSQAVDASGFDYSDPAQ